MPDYEIRITPLARLLDMVGKPEFLESPEDAQYASEPYQAAEADHAQCPGWFHGVTRVNRF